MEPSISDAELRRLYIRVCRDSRFRLSATDAAHFTAKVLGVDAALRVWLVLGLDSMERIANGTHPCLNDPQYR